MLLTMNLNLLHSYFFNGYNYTNKKIRVCLVTVFSPYFLFSKTIFYFCKKKKLVWQPKIDRKQKLFLKLNL